MKFIVLSFKRWTLKRLHKIQSLLSHAVPSATKYHQQPATKYHRSTIATHVNDLHNILKEEKKAAYIILSDGGPDYSPLNLVNRFFTSDSFKNWTLIPLGIYICS